MRFLLMAIVLSSVISCSSDKHAPPNASACPDEIHEAHKTWGYSSGDKDTCTELAAALNMDTADAGEDECGVQMGAFELATVAGACKATLKQTCDEKTLDVSCTVTKAGSANCTARITADGIDCVLTLLTS